MLRNNSGDFQEQSHQLKGQLDSWSAAEQDGQCHTEPSTLMDRSDMSHLEHCSTAELHLTDEEQSTLRLSTSESEWRSRLLEARMRASEARMRASEARETALQQAVAAKETRLAELAAEIEGLHQIQKAQEMRLARQASALQRAEEIRKLTLSRCHQFRTRFEEQLQVYKQQRAWRLMLWCRKAYAICFAPRLADKLNLLKFAAATVAGRGFAEDQELSFPSLPCYMPHEIMEPFDHPGASTSVVTGVIGADSDLPVLPRPVKYDVIILAIIDFDFRFQRPQQLAVRFAREGHRVFWVSPTRYLPSSASKPYELIQLDRNIWELHLRGQQPDVYMGLLDDTTAAQFTDALTKLYRDCGIVENCAIVQLPFWRSVALRLRSVFGTTIAYDCMDDWEAFPGFGPFNIAEERLLASQADVLIATAQNLVDKFKGRGVAPILVRNASDFDFFSKEPGRECGLGAIPRPIVGYFGAIADWMDLDLIYHVARLRPRYSFVLIGKVFDCDTSQLKSLANVHLLGHKEYEDIPSYLREFDVCIIPFLVNQVTNATDPVKMYEYLSQGKPVVATALAELLPLGDLLYIGRNATEFADRIDQALLEDTDQMRSRRIEFAAANTWTHRYGCFDAAIRKAFPPVSIVIVTHNSEHFLGPCIDSVVRNTAYPNFDIILVDNASQDGTPSLIDRCVSAHTRVQGFCLTENLGFAAGTNFGVKRSTGDYIIFLNADTLATAGWMEILLRHHRRDPAIGLLTAMTNFAGNEIKINVDYGTQTEMEHFAACLNRANFGRSFDIDVAPLYCALMPRRAWDIVGELDESFGIGMFEDDDLSMRVRQAGYRVVAAEDCFVHHFGQGSFSALTSDQYQEIFERNRQLYERKWQAPWKAHQPRTGVRPAYEDVRFHPAVFCK